MLSSTLQQDFVSTNVKYFETTLFPLSSIITSEVDDDNLLVCYVPSPIPTPTPTFIKFLIT